VFVNLRLQTCHAVLTCLLPIVIGLSCAQGSASAEPAALSDRTRTIASFESFETEQLAKAQAAVDQLVLIKGDWTIENTLVPYDEALRHLDAASNLAGLMQQVNPDAAFRDHATAMTARVSDMSTALSLNQSVYKALSSVPLATADAATRYYVQRQLLEFRQAGVDKDDATRAHLKQLNDQLTDALSMFDRNLSDGQLVVEVDDPSELQGLPADYLAEHKPGPDGKVRITTNYPDIFPALTYARSEDLRRRLMVAFGNRGFPKNRDVLKRMMRLRYEIATTLGYHSWADYNAADKMIGSGKNIADFLQQLNAVAHPLAEREASMLLAEKRKTHPHAKDLQFYDSDYYADQVRRSSYDFDSQSVRPYLAYNGVKQGVLATAAALFHITFRQQMNVTLWDPSVETWEVIDGGQVIGRFYLDMHPRPGKYSHAEMAPLLVGVKGKQLPEAVLVCNFAAPTADSPGLMDYDDVVTFFHEFGHLMHHILGGQQAWAGIGGISMEQDFGEAPSQMLEEWMRSPQVLASFAHDYRTGQPIPAALVARMNHASSFGRAGTISTIGVAFQIALAQISYDLYKDKPDAIDIDRTVFQDLQQYTMYVPTPGTHFDASFSHLGGYSSAYYTYMWDKVIALDFFQQFDKDNLLGGPAPMRYRRAVLEPGGSKSANTLIKDFLGRPQNTRAFQQWLGAEFEK
jgi:thimet oligopeptidase